MFKKQGTHLGLLLRKTQKRPLFIFLFFFLLFLLFFSLSMQSYADELPVVSAVASSYSGSYLPSKTIDKNLSTYWQGALLKAPWILTFDLTKSYSLTKISILWHKTSGATNYVIQASSNGATWVNLQSNLSSAGGAANPNQKDYNLSGFYRYVRFYISKAQSWNPIIYEVKLYGVSLPTGTIKINNNAEYTNNVAVALNLSAQDGSGGINLSQMQFSNDNKSWSVPETYTITKAWTLASGDGTKTVYGKFKDTAGNWSIAYLDSIILDTQGPALGITTPKNNEVIK